MINYYDKYRNSFISSSIDGIQDPLYLTFGLKFEFFPRIDPGESLEPGLLTGGSRKFLSSRGDDLRVQKLDYFVSMLRKFSVDEPWWFTQLSGINKLLELNLTGGRIPDDTSFTVSARESIDMKFLSMIESYRSTIQDKVYMREILSKNLRFFDMSVYLIDPRILITQEKNKKDLIYDDDTQGVIVLKLKDCEFVFNDFNGSLGSISNENGESTVTYNFSIKPRRIVEVYNLPTRELFGYGGTGYFSDDSKSDFNFLKNFIRPKSGLYAESGNERRIKDEKIYKNYSEYKNSNELNIKSSSDESVEESKNKRKIKIPTTVESESSIREKLNLGTIEMTSEKREKLNLGKNKDDSHKRIPEFPKKINEESNKRDVLKLGILEMISNKPPIRTIK